MIPVKQPGIGLDFCSFCSYFLEPSYLFYLLNNKHKSQNIFLIYNLPVLIYFDRTEVRLHTKAQVVFGCLEISLESLQEIPGLGRSRGAKCHFFQGSQSSNKVANPHSFF